MGLFSQCPARRFIDGLTDRYVEDGARILLSGFISAIGARTIYLRTGLSPEMRASVERETGSSLAGSVLAGEPRRIETHPADQGVGVLSVRMTQIPMLPRVSGGVTFGVDEEPISPRTQWHLVFHRGPLLLLEIDISDGTGFKPPRGWVESLTSRGAAHICWESKKGYVGSGDHLYLFFKRLKVFPHSKHSSNEEGIQAGIHLRQLCRDVWSKHGWEQAGVYQLSSGRGSQQRFVRKFDKMLLDRLGPEALTKVLEQMGTTLHEWVKAAI